MMTDDVVVYGRVVCRQACIACTWATISYIVSRISQSLDSQSRSGSGGRGPLSQSTRKR